MPPGSVNGTSALHSLNCAQERGWVPSLWARATHTEPQSQGRVPTSRALLVGAPRWAPCPPTCRRGGRNRLNPGAPGLAPWSKTRPHASVTPPSGGVGCRGQLTQSRPCGVRCRPADGRGQSSLPARRPRKASKGRIRALEPAMGGTSTNHARMLSCSGGGGLGGGSSRPGGRHREATKITAVSFGKRSEITAPVAMGALFVPGGAAARGTPPGGGGQPPPRGGQGAVGGGANVARSMRAHMW